MSRPDRLDEILGILIGYEPGLMVRQRKSEAKAALEAYVREKELRLQIADRQVILGWMEANQDNLTVKEIVATIQGQTTSLENELAALTTNQSGKEPDANP